MHLVIIRAQWFIYVVTVFDAPTISEYAELLKRQYPHRIRELFPSIKGLGGDRTVILSTHILSEVSAICEKIVIINNGRIAAEGSPESLRAQLREGEALRAQISGAADKVQETLRQVNGVVQVQCETGGDAGADGVYTVVTSPDADVRDALSRAVINGGFGLRELRSLDMSLEEIYLRLTTEEVGARDA